jgi:hypothetical protein
MVVARSYKRLPVFEKFVIEGKAVNEFLRFIMEAEEKQVAPEELDQKEVQILDAAAKEFTAELKDLVDELQANPPKDEKNEVGVLLGVSIGVALPKILSIIAKIVKLIRKTFFKGKDEAMIESKLNGIAEFLHEKYVGLLQKLVAFLGVKDKTKAAKVSEILYTVIVAGLFAGSSVGVMDAVSNSNLATAGLEGMLSAIKGREIQTAIPDIIKFVTKAVA